MNTFDLWGNHSRGVEPPKIGAIPLILAQKVDGMVIFTSIYNVILNDRGWKVSLFVTFCVLMTLLLLGVILIASQRLYDHGSCNCPLNGDETNRDDERRRLLFDDQRQGTTLEQQYSDVSSKSFDDINEESDAMTDGRPCCDVVE